MSDTTLLFQYCQKIVVFNEARDAVLLAKRKGEADFDGTFSFIGGKLETFDGGLLSGLQREKNEEIGTTAKLKICPSLSHNEYYIKKDGNAMVLPHYLAIYTGGDIALNEEYSEYEWVKLSELHDFKPKIDTIEPAVQWAIRIAKVTPEEEFVVI